MTIAHNPLSLLKTRRFLPLFTTQFLGAFNDNVLKQALLLLITFQGGKVMGLSPALMVQVASGLFVLPMFLFSASAGQIADAFDKARLVRWVKLAEVGIALIAAAGFFFKQVPLLLSALFLMGLHSTVFGPLKYSILPQHLHNDEIVGGNAWVESGTFVAILLGSILGGVLIAIPDTGPIWAGGACVLLAVCGWLTSLSIPDAPPLAKVALNWNPFSEIAQNMRIAGRNRAVLMGMMGISWFWFYGAMMLSQFGPFVKDVIGGSEHLSTFLLSTFIIGIALGSLLAERASGGKVELGLVPLASIGMTVFGVDLYFASPSAPHPGLDVAGFIAQPGAWRLMADLVLIGVFGGLYTIPLYALIQTRCDPEYRSRIIAANNILNAGFMVASAGYAFFALSQGASIPQMFLYAALMNIAVAIFIYSVVPEFLQRLIVWLLVHTFYRVEAKGYANIPAEGPAVIVCNHVSFVDPLILMAESRRPIRFVMDHRIFKMPIINFVFREGRAIPIAPAKEDPAMLEAAYDEVAKTLEAGELVGIFPEGRITDTGELNEFKSGVTRIVERTPVPVVPMALSGLWGSFFSRKDGPAMSKPFRRGFFSRIKLSIGAPIAPGNARPEILQAEIAQLRERP
ncbi:MFS transporter [Niveibacterium sp. 24ML]|uniref:MFS transporter n=1 Tax=Niveibacterium sp. 24ML TaxID=2985512 RepID=UPI00226DAB37|nr:MFS transporter [Niveibacterium sp. 24ML]MCX9157346.1 MFS transporter [Niveibacterium sp. 24ML]